MKIIVDAMGGDNAPEALVQGALEANRTHGVDIILVGRAAEVLRAVESCGRKTCPPAWRSGTRRRWWRSPTTPPLPLR